jgi:ABC-2 type transport system permease protein
VSSLVRTEVLKQRTLRTFLAGWAAAPVVAALATIAIFAAAGRNGNDPLDSRSLVHAVGAPTGVVTVVALLLGVVGMAGEYRHETITDTFLSRPRRRDVLTAKLAAYAITGAVLATAAAAVSAAVAVPWLHSRGIPIELDVDLLRTVAGGVVTSALYGALGVSIGALIRNQTAACAVVLVWLLAVEGIIGDVFAGSAFVQWLPAAAAHAIVDVGARGDALPAPVAAAVFGAYVCVAAAVATRSTLRRDVT